MAEAPLGKVIPLHGRRRPGPPAVEAVPPVARDRRRPAWSASSPGGLAFLRRRITGDYEVDDFGFDADLTEHVLLPPLRPLYDKWFRVETRGLDNVPDTGGALVVANHSGTIPLDALMTALALLDHHPAHRHLRMLGADLVFTLPVVAPLARKAGNTLACNADAERLLSAGELVGVWPEGFKGIGKPFSERYKLQRFGRGGFVSAALRTGVPIIPCSIVGAEETYPMIGNARTLARLLGLPYLPVTPTFPLLGPLGAVPLPSKWIIEFGEPIETRRSAARPRPRTRCWSSTSPTRCARRSRARSTRCSCSAARSSSSRAGPPAGRGRARPALQRQPADDRPRQGPGPGGRRHADLGGLAAGAEVAHLPAAGAGLLAQAPCRG